MLLIERYLEYKKLYQKFEEEYSELKESYCLVNNTFELIKQEILSIDPFLFKVPGSLGYQEVAEQDIDIIIKPIHKELDFVIRHHALKYVPESFTFTFQDLETWEAVIAAGFEQIQNFNKSRFKIEEDSMLKIKEKEELALLKSLMLKYPDFQAR